MAGEPKTENKMICPRCGIEMTHHGDKIMYAANPEQAAPIDPTMGGFIEEFHACPKCGGGASRHS